MISLEEHLLIKLSEECSEVIKASMKALRFGTKDRGPGNVLNNAEMINDEVIDLYVIINMLVEHGVISAGNSDLDYEIYKARREKVLKYMNYSRVKGTLAYEEKEIK